MGVTDPLSSMQDRAVYRDQTCSVLQVHAWTGEMVGSGPRIIQFLYKSPVEKSKVVFPPVGVRTEEEAVCVAALVREAAEEFNKRNIPSLRNRPVQYFTTAV